MVILVKPSGYLPSLDVNPLCFSDGGGCNHCQSLNCVINICTYKGCEQYCIGYLCHPSKLSPAGNIDSE